MKRAIPVVIALALSACASSPPETQAAEASSQEKEYRTGSRIPVRDSTSSSPTTTLDPAVLTPGLPTRTY
jgi:hypothetical protein